jgi:ferredoxin
MNHRKCINCGACVLVCGQGVRRYQDDLVRLLNNLKMGSEVSLIVEGHVLSNFPHYKNLFRYLKHLGVKKIYDGSLGLELFAWAHLRYFEKYRPFSLISSRCPVVVGYCQKHLPELLPRLSPIVGPAVAQAIYLREHLNISGSIAFLGACPVASASSKRQGGPDYVLSFQRLIEHLSKNQVDLGLFGEDPELDQDEELILPYNLTLKKAIKTFLDNNIRVDSAKGPESMELLREYAKSPVEHLAPVFEPLFCRHGCAMGMGKAPDNSFFKSRALLEDRKRSYGEAQAIEHMEQSFKDFDILLRLELFTQTLSPQGQIGESVSEEELERSFQLLGKAPGNDRQVDCGYCGNETCKAMAMGIALKNNVPENCVARMKVLNAYMESKNQSYLELIQNVSEYLLLSMGDDFNSNVEHALMALCYSMDAFSASLWKNVYDSEEKPVCQCMVTYPSKLVNKNLISVTLDDPKGWLDALMDGNSVMRLKSNMTRAEQRKFLGRNVNTILMTPIIAHGDFWGFMALLKEEEKIFSQEDIAVISICSNILASSLINQNLQGSFLDDNFSLM